MESREDYQSFQEFLNTKLKERGLSLEELAKSTGVSLKHIESLSHGRFEHLPPAPYLRGYLVKIAATLDFDMGYWWKEIKHEESVHRSGSRDQLPSNRYLKKRKGWWAWILALVILLGAYVGFRAPQIFGHPQLEVLSPEQTLTETQNDHFVLRGVLEDGDLFINDEAIPINADATWEKEVILQEGLNTFEMKAKRFLGKETIVMRQVLLELKPLAPSTTTSTAP